MADDQDFDIWGDAEFLAEAVQRAEAVVQEKLTEAAVCNPTQPPPPPQQLFPPPPPQQLFPPPPPLHYAPHISYSPPRELSQRMKDDNHRQFPDKVFDGPVSLNGISKGFNSAPSFPHSSRLHDEDKCAKQKEIDRLKEELGRVSKELTNLEQECLDLRKDREKNEKLLRSVLPVNGSKDTEAYCTKKPNLKNKDPIEDHSVIHLGTKGVISCKAVGVQTDENAISTDVTKKNLLVSRKLACIWEPLNDYLPKTNLVSKLFVGCEADLQVIFGFVGLNIPSEKIKMDPNHCIQAVEAAKVSHFYSTFTQISYDIGRLDEFLEALVDLCCLQNAMIVQRSLCILHVVLKHIVSMENRLCSRDNLIVENTNETSNSHHSVLARLSLKNESQTLVSSSKWFSLFQMMNQVVTSHVEEIIRVEAVSIMNIILLRTDAYTEREMYGNVAVFQSISQLLRKEAGACVQKQTVHLLFLLLNCPQLMSMFCSFCKEEGTTAEIPMKNAETTPALQGDATAILDGLADCLACANGAPTTLVLKLQRNAIILLAFLASTGRSGFEVLMGHRRPHFLYIILQILASEIDAESSHPSDDVRERTLLIREALILLNRLASNPQYSTPVLHVLTNRRDMAILSIDIATRLSRKGNWLWQSDTARQTRESEIVDLARIFKKRVFTFLGDEK